MNQFQDDDDDFDGEKKSKFKNSKKTGDINKFKRDKNAPQVAKVETKEKKVDKVFKPMGKATLGNKWGSEDLDNDKKLAMEKLKQLEEKVQDEEIKPQKKEPKFVGKANITQKAKDFEEEEKERQRIAQEKLKLIEENLAKPEVKIELVKDKPKEKRFVNSKKEVDNGLKRKKNSEHGSELNDAKTKEKKNMGNNDKISNGDTKKTIKTVDNVQVNKVQVTTTTANKW